jgi:S-(hydroxymethyl)glutathione dehydrogenase / alcohol dehydrogenase
MDVKAAVLYGVGHELQVETLTLADPQPNDVLVRVVGSGVCGSDTHVIDGELPSWQCPIVLGHEAAGVVEAVGSQVRYVKPGDHVVLGWTPGCGHCPTCWSGNPRLCPNLPYNGLHYDGRTRFSKNGTDIHAMAHVGGFSDHVVVGERTCVKIREDAPLEKVCLIGCGVATGYGAVFFDAQVHPGSSAVVIGCGGVGLNVIQSLALAAATQIIAVDINHFKLGKAREFGATHTIDAKHEDVIGTIRELTQGRGVDYGFEVISTTPTIRQAFDATRMGGTVVVVGVVSPPGAEVSIPASPKKTVRSGAPGGVQWTNTPLLVDLYMAGKLKLDELVSKERPLQEVNEAFADLRAGEVARTVLLPSKA